MTQLIDYQNFCGIVPETPQEKNVKNGIPQITVKELKALRDTGEDFFLLDVREPYEYQIAQIGGTLIPQNDVPNRLAEIPRDREIIVQCRSGARSQRIAELLQQAGYTSVANLAGVLEGRPIGGTGVVTRRRDFQQHASLRRVIRLFPRNLRNSKRRSASHGAGLHTSFLVTGPSNLRRWWYIHAAQLLL